MIELCVVLAVLVVATAVGLRRRAVDGRLRLSPPAAVPRSEDAEHPSTPLAGAAPAEHAEGVLTVDMGALGSALGSRATLLQFSSAFCAPCRTARVVLGDVAEQTAGVAHVEVDAESHLDLVVAMGVRRTPTTLVLDPAGRVVGRAVGAPRKAEVLAALAAL